LPLTAGNLDIKMVLKNPQRIINIVLIIISLILSLNIYNGQKKELLNYQKRLDSEKNKNELLRELSVLENKLRECRNALKIKDTSEMISTVTELSEKAGLKILTVKPQPEEDNPLYKKSRLKLLLEAEDYHAIGNFIAQLEANEDLYKIESLSIRPAKRSGVQLVTSDGKLEEERVLNLEMVIVRFIFKG